MKNVTKQRYLDAGLCVKCGGNRDTKSTRCSTCRKTDSKNMSDLRNRRIKAGLCAHCGKCPPDGGLRNCRPCADKLNRRTRRQSDRMKRRGLCVVCGCPNVLEGQKQKARPKCETCYLKNVASSVCGDRSSWELLKELWDDCGAVCALSGEPITLGTNAHLDHILPRSTHPELKDQPSNWQWTHEEINQMKRALTPERFVELCEKVTLCRRS